MSSPHADKSTHASTPTHLRSCDKLEWNATLRLPWAEFGCELAQNNERTVTQTATFHDSKSGRSYPDAKAMVNDYVARFAHAVGVELPPLDDTGYTAVQKGSATVGINVLESGGVLMVLAKVSDPVEDPPVGFFRQLLELNFVNTGQGAFALDEATGAIYLRALRGLTSLDYEEFESLIHAIATRADHWDDHLPGLLKTQGE